MHTVAIVLTTLVAVAAIAGVAYGVMYLWAESMRD